MTSSAQFKIHGVKNADLSAKVGCSVSDGYCAVVQFKIHNSKFIIICDAVRRAGRPVRNGILSAMGGCSVSDGYCAVAQFKIHNS